MPRKRSAIRACSKCYLPLPHGRRMYAELRGGWTVEHESGGAHNVLHPDSTGLVLCALCFEEQRPQMARPILPPLCTDCREAPVRYRQLRHAFTQLPATKAVHDARYGPMHLCRKCWLRRMEGEQLALFDA